MNKTFILLLLFGAVSCDNISQSKLRVQKFQNRVDTVIAGDSANIFYTLYNDGDKDIIIEDYVLSCECTTSQLNKGTIIAKKDSIYISFTIRSDTSEKAKKKNLLCTLKCNTKPQIQSIKIPIYIR